MARRVSRRNPLEDAIRLRDEAARLHARLDGLVHALIAEETALQRQGKVGVEPLPPCGARRDGSIPEPLVLHRYWIGDERTGACRLTSFHLTAEDAAERYPGAQAESSTREERLPGAYSRAEAPTKPGEGGSSEG